MSGTRREWWRLGAIVGAVVAVVLGCVGLTLGKPGIGPLDALYGSLQLFVLSDDKIGDPPFNWWLDVARFLAPATTVYAVFEALRALLGGEIRRRRIAGRRGHVIVCGDIAVVVGLLAEAIRSEQQRRVVAVTPTAVPVGHRDRHDQIDWVQGDPRDASTLRAAGVRAAAALFACAEGPDTNTAVVLTAAQQRPATTTDRRERLRPRFEAYAEVGDDELVGALRVRRLAADVTRQRVMIDFFSLLDTAARDPPERWLDRWRWTYRFRGGQWLRAGPGSTVVTPVTTRRGRVARRGPQ